MLGENHLRTDPVGKLGDTHEDAPGSAAEDTDRDLVAEIACVLARKPRRLESASTPLAGDEEPQTAPDTTACVSPTARRAFISALHHEPSVTSPPRAKYAPDSDADATETGERADQNGDAPVPRDTAAWLAAAKRRNQRATLHEAGAWMATVAIGTAIVIVAAVLLFEGPGGLAAWIDLAPRTL